MGMSRNISLYFTEKEYSFLVDMINRSATSSSSGISKGGILRALVRMLQQLDVNLAGVKTEDELLKRLKDSLQ